jgi:hypothetical protein
MMILSRLKLGLVLGALTLSCAAAEQFGEYQVKAAFVSNFAGFVEWPQAVFQNASDPFTICVLGQDPFGSSLTNVVAGRSVGGHPLRVNVVSDIKPGMLCQIVFISSSEKLRFRAIFEALRTASTLTVGDTDDFVSEGGMIALRLDDGKVRMKINQKAAKDRNLRVSSHLLSLAEGSK